MEEEVEREAETEAVEEAGEAQAEISEQEEGAAEKAAAVEDELEEAPDELEKLREELEEAEAQADEYLDGWQRARAELSNYKKRQEAERAQMRALASVTLLRQLLPIVDDFARAVATLPAALRQLTWCEGVFLIMHKLDAVLQSAGVEPIDAEGQMFDPRYHEAVTHEEVEGYEEGQVIDELQRGFTLGERVLRPALVRVAKAPVGGSNSEEGTDTGGDD